ncbi:MAG: HYR domain-containing protein, partial [Saprospiraceae bacterium]|nr:HYR domain-containing protein [Saprospiraceae bacterium]
MMNKKLNHLLALVMVLLCTVGMLSAQQIVNMPAVGNAGTFSQFNGPNTFYSFYDSGGSGGNYSSNNNGRVTFAPQTAGAKVQAVFSAFNTETNFDALYVFDGTTTGSPKIVGPAGAPLGNNVYGTGGFWGTTAPNNIAPNTIRATAANASGALTFAFTSDGSVQPLGWAATVTQFIPCNPVPGGPLSVGLSPGVCVANLDVTLPASYNPAGCINDVANNLRYILDANPPVNIPKPLPASILISNIPSGSHVITWQVYTGTGSVVGEATQNLEVNDTEPPTLNCPSDIIINLDPGLCCAYVSWGEVTATDNCPFVGPVMTHSQIPQVNAGWYGFATNLENLSADDMIISQVTVRASATPAGNYNFKVFMIDGTFQPNMNSNVGWTACADASFFVNGTFTTGGGSDVVIPLTTPYTIPAGQTAGIYYVHDNGTTLNRRIMYNGAATTSNDGNIRIYDGAGINAGIFNGIAFQPRGAHIHVDYQLGGEAMVMKDFGPDSGDELCKDDSPWIVQYSAEDVAGNIGTCSFEIQVLEYANPTTKLACNDNVQISLDEDCVTEVGADDVLEGGPYGCYDDYDVTIFNANNTPLASSPFVGRQQIGGTWKVKVTDPETGNSCWGLLTVEDKLAPV